jgi:hypothetical protein
MSIDMCPKYVAADALSRWRSIPARPGTRSTRTRLLMVADELYAVPSLTAGFVIHHSARL